MIKFSNTATRLKKAGLLVLSFSVFWAGTAQEPTNDVTTPLHLLQADYPTPYGAKSVEEITATLDRVYSFLDAATPSKIIDGETNKEITNYKKLDGNSVFATGSFRLTSYEWGVTYAGMLLATEATGDSKYAEYTNKRLQLIADIAPYYKAQLAKDKNFP